VKIEKKIHTGIEFKLIDEGADKKFVTFEAYASTFGNRDLGGDIVVKGAFTRSLKDRTPRLLWMHDQREPAGVITSAIETDKGLLITGKLSLTDTLTKGRLIPQLELGGIDSMSIGYCAIDYEMTKEGYRLLKEVYLYEISFVTMPMNPQAVVLGVKSVVPYQDLPLADDTLEWDAAAAIGRVREFTRSTEVPSERYRQAFLWFDSEKSDQFGAYKLPIADVIGGELKVIPRAVFASAAAMRGARGGVDIPDADRPGVQANIERYYAKMQRDSPFKSYAPLFADAKTIRDLEAVLQGAPGFSDTEAKTLISRVADLKNIGQRDAGQGGAGGLADELKQLTASLKPMDQK